MAASATAAKTSVTCFVPDYRVKDGVNFEQLSSVCTQVILSGQQIGTGGEYEDVMLNIPRGASLEQLQKARAETGLKVLIGVGAPHTMGLAFLIPQTNLHERFIKQTINLLEKNNLDGINLDPLFHRVQSYDPKVNPIGHIAQWGFKELAKFLMTLSKALKSRNKMLSMTYQVMHEEHLLNATGKIGKQITDLVDQFIASAYDTVLPWDQKEQKMQPSARAMGAVTKGAWLRAFPENTLSKVHLGLPFYGRHETRGESVEGYAELVTREQIEDDDVDYADGYYLNNIGTVKGKLNYAAASGFGGVSINEVGQDLAMDNDKSLLAAIKSELASSSFPTLPTSPDYTAKRLPAIPKPKPKPVQPDAAKTEAEEAQTEKTEEAKEAREAKIEEDRKMWEGQDL